MNGAQFSFKNMKNLWKLYNKLRYEHCEQKTKAKRAVLQWNKKATIKTNIQMYR